MNTYKTFLNPHDPLVKTRLAELKEKFELALAENGKALDSRFWHVRTAAKIKLDKAEKAFWDYKARVR